jgi:hypothetical protein
MKHQIKSIRTFIGAKDFEVSRQFYSALNFTEHAIGPKLSYFEADGFGFYLQDYYLKEWIENTMIFLEVDDVKRYWDELVALELTTAYDGVKLTPIRVESWGRECFLHDPAGVLWHFGEFI